MILEWEGLKQMCKTTEFQIAKHNPCCTPVTVTVKHEFLPYAQPTHKTKNTHTHIYVAYPLASPSTTCLTPRPLALPHLQTPLPHLLSSLAFPQGFQVAEKADPVRTKFRSDSCGAQSPISGSDGG